MADSLRLLDGTTRIRVDVYVTISSDQADSISSSPEEVPDVERLISDAAVAAFRRHLPYLDRTEPQQLDPDRERLPSTEPL